MTSKQKVLSQYPEAVSFKAYGFFSGSTTTRWYVILNKSDIESDYYGDTPQEAWVNAAKSLEKKK